jgi:Na+/melibiose symporter-like transporter
MAVWFVPDIEDQGQRTLWYIVAYCIFQTSISCFHVPYTSLTMVLSSNQADRDSATAWSKFMFYKIQIP